MDRVAYLPIPLSHSDKKVDLHVLAVPASLWRADLRFSYNSVCVESVSLGFVRAYPDDELCSLRDEISNQLDLQLLPDSYCFLRSVGKCLTQVAARQEKLLKVRHFLPPLALCPEIYILDGAPSLSLPPLPAPAAAAAATTPSLKKWGDNDTAQPSHTHDSTTNPTVFTAHHPHACTPPLLPYPLPPTLLHQSQWPPPPPPMNGVSPTVHSKPPPSTQLLPGQTLSTGQEWLEQQQHHPQQKQQQQQQHMQQQQQQQQRRVGQHPTSFSTKPVHFQHLHQHTPALHDDVHSELASGQKAPTQTELVTPEVKLNQSVDDTALHNSYNRRQRPAHKHTNTYPGTKPSANPLLSHHGVEYTPPRSRFTSREQKNATSRGAIEPNYQRTAKGDEDCSDGDCEEGSELSEDGTPSCSLHSILSVDVTDPEVVERTAALQRTLHRPRVLRDTHSPKGESGSSPGHQSALADKNTVKEGADISQKQRLKVNFANELSNKNTKRGTKRIGRERQPKINTVLEASGPGYLMQDTADRKSIKKKSEAFPSSSGNIPLDNPSHTPTNATRNTLQYSSVDATTVQSHSDTLEPKHEFSPRAPLPPIRGVSGDPSTAEEEEGEGRGEGEWRRRYRQEKKQTAAFEDRIKRLRSELQLVQSEMDRKVRSRLRGSLRSSPMAKGAPSQHSNVKSQCRR